MAISIGTSFNGATALGVKPDATVGMTTYGDRNSDAAAGYTVAANYAGNDEAAKKFTDETGIKTYKWSVADYDACAAGVKQVEAELGPIEVLVNNAGITRDTAFHKMSLDQWNAVISTNLGSLFNMTRQVIEGMRARKFGRIVNISSINGQKGQFGQVNYSAAKAGDIGFTKALALETARGGITVNVICPGYINTEMVQAVPPKVLEGIIAHHPPPAVAGRRLKIKYVTQAKTRPPGFVLSVSRPEAFPQSYVRYLTNSLRESFDMPGVPIRVSLRATDNPFAGKAKKRR